MKNLFPIIILPLASVMTTTAETAELITHAVELVAQIIIALVALATLIRNYRRK